MSVDVQKQVSMDFPTIQIQSLASPAKSYTLMQPIANSIERDRAPELDNESLSPSPNNNTEVTYVQLAQNFKVKSEPHDGEHFLTQPTYTLVQSNGLVDGKILELHGINDIGAKLAATSYQSSARGIAVIVPSEANFAQNYVTSLKQSPDIAASLASLYSHNGVYTTQGIHNSASSDSSTDQTCTPQKASYIYAKPPTSPSPYTANTERARSFNAYVKQLIEAKMDCKIPISLQPKHLVDDIMNEAKKHFPEFETCTRKRIRTFLKSCRRSKKFRQQQIDDTLMMKKNDHSLNVSPVSTSDLRHSSPSTHIILNQMQPQFVTPVTVNSSSRSTNIRSMLPQITTSSYQALAQNALLINPLSNNTTSQLAQIPIPQQISQITAEEGSVDGKTSPSMSEINELSTDMHRKSSDSDDGIPVNGHSSLMSDEESSFRAVTPPSSSSDTLNNINTLTHISNSGMAINGHLTQQLMHRQLNGTNVTGIHSLSTLQHVPLHKGHSLNYNNSDAIRSSSFELQRKRNSPSLEESSPKKLNGDSVLNSVLGQVTNLSAYSYANPLSGVFSNNLNEFPNQPNGYPKVSKSEVKKIQELIDGYRVSAAFLTKAAHELEKLIYHEDSRLH